jgi:hypothetical protein
MMSVSVLLAQPSSADLIIHNARIYTVDARNPIAEAIAVRADRVARVGTNVQVLQLKGASTRMIDASQATIVPGLQDSHGHFVALGSLLETLNLRGTTSYEQVIDSESLLGSLEEGKLADLVVLSKDIMRVAPKETLTTTVRMTIIGGEVVFEQR